MKTFSKKPVDENRIPVSCNYCGSQDWTTVAESDDYRFVRCRNCGLVYQNPLPIGADIVKRYDEEYFSYEIENEKQFFHLMWLGLEDVHFFSWEKQLLDKGVFLDIGCATGRLLATLRERHWNVMGVEVCRASATYAIEKRNLDVCIGTLEESGLPENSCSVVHCSHVIEHVSDPRRFFQEIKRILIPRGVLILTTPNIDGFQARIFGNRWRSMIADHLYLFSRKTMRRYFTAFDFKVKEHNTWGGLAAGTAPRWIKSVVDKGAKRFGCGDVMIFLAVSEVSKIG